MRPIVASSFNIQTPRDQNEKRQHCKPTHLWSVLESLCVLVVFVFLFFFEIWFKKMTHLWWVLESVRPCCFCSLLFFVWKFEKNGGYMPYLSIDCKASKPQKKRQCPMGFSSQCSTGVVFWARGAVVWRAIGVLWVVILASEIESFTGLLEEQKHSKLLYIPTGIYSYILYIYTV